VKLQAVKNVLTKCCDGNFCDFGLIGIQPLCLEIQQP